MKYRTDKVAHSVATRNAIKDNSVSVLERLLAEGIPGESLLSFILFDPVTGSLKIRAIGVFPDGELLREIFLIAANKVGELSRDIAESDEEESPPILN